MQGLEVLLIQLARIKPESVICWRYPSAQVMVLCSSDVLAFVLLLRLLEYLPLVSLQQPP